jgi:hypothetical protein
MGTSNWQMPISQQYGLLDDRWRRAYRNIAGKQLPEKHVILHKSGDIGSSSHVLH